MKVTIIYDNEVLVEGVQQSWGFSAWIEADDKNILFDTGWDGRILLDNMKALGFNPADIDAIVLSHQHWDHMGGLTHILEVAKEANVYLLPSFSENYKNEIERKANVVEAGTPTKISGKIQTLGELTCVFNDYEISEQSLAVDTGKGVLVLVGCSHPGVDVILERAGEFGVVYGIISGFHGFRELEAFSDLELIVPCHCTKHKKIILEKFPMTAEFGGVGWSKVL